ncbi:hypothetical protein N8I77_010960 [Diaporthe amygdali]|uniref:Peptidase C45 hydrolase domain-containing protein n=2 Tax=Phomopsis amygdali TaxID=1214568 RepID=A0AAD9W2C9_PHOAM|nr:hypothetical protein N8I77_010960 [Diaporthe amygdali]
MTGVAEGASLSLEDILVLNTRSEIMFGNAGDGCTAFSWKSPTTSSSWLAQNWDFHLSARENLIAQTIIRSSDAPVISQIIEAGMLGKIGLNSAGVGVGLNAVVAPGTDFKRLPVHIALRAVLENRSRKEAVEFLDRVGLASACHILVADAASGGVGLEFSAVDCASLKMDARGIVTHTNHFLRPHEKGVVSQVSFATQIRLSRVNELLREVQGQEANRGVVEGILADELYWPYSINRSAGKETPAVTLFSIAMDLDRREATVKIGRPTEPIAELVLTPGLLGSKSRT